MKAIISKKNPTVIAVCVDKVKHNTLLSISKELHSDVIFTNNTQATAEQLLNGKASTAVEDPSLSNSECLLFSNFSNDALNTFLDVMRSVDLNVKLKAVVTPHNLKWTLSELIAELESEHKTMTGGDKDE